MKKSNPATTALIAFVLVFTCLVARAQTLNETGLSVPPVFNVLGIGNGGSQIVSPPMTQDGIMNIFYLQTSAPEVFNYTLTYAATSAATADARIWTGTVDPLTGWSSGAWLAQPVFVATDPTRPVTIRGSFAMGTGTTYGLIAGLYDASNSANGSYNLSWDVTSTPTHPTMMDIQVASVPEPETYAMLLAGFGLIGAVTRRRQTAKSASYSQ